MAPHICSYGLCSDHPSRLWLSCRWKRDNVVRDQQHLLELPRLLGSGRRKLEPRSSSQPVVFLLRLHPVQDDSLPIPHPQPLHRHGSVLALEADVHEGGHCRVVYKRCHLLVTQLLLVLGPDQEGAHRSRIEAVQEQEGKESRIEHLWLL